MTKFEKREIETFEMGTEYYVNSFTYGNKDHVCRELAEMFYNHPIIFAITIADLPKKIRKMVVRSQYSKDANLMIDLERQGNQKMINYLLSNN